VRAVHARQVMVEKPFLSAGLKDVGGVVVVPLSCVVGLV
jgi:hypothetical protein